MKLYKRNRPIFVKYPASVLFPLTSLCKLTFHFKSFITALKDSSVMVLKHNSLQSMLNIHRKYCLFAEKPKPKDRSCCAFSFVRAAV